MIGQVIGNYKVAEKVGEGGMGTVFRGIDIMLDREVAIKMLRPELAQDPQVVSRFRSEAVTLAKLNHPNIATLYSFLRQGDDFFMVMEYVRGETLDKAIQRQGAMACDRCLGLFCEALQGIKRAHKLGIVHRDIKPANMMLTEDGSIKVMDFGIARVLGTARMTRQGNIVGTIEYMSPEQIRGENADARSDIYSLGILLYEMLTGRVPFMSDTEFSLMMSQINDPPPSPRTFAPNIPIPVEQAILQALAKKPEERFQNVEEFRLSLEHGARPAALRSDAVGVSAPIAPGAVQQAPAGVGALAGIVKETRLSAGDAAPADFSAGLMKETRLAQATDPGLQTATVPNATPVFAQPQQTGGLFSKLSWIHYGAAGGAVVLLFAIVGLSFAFLTSGGDKGSGKGSAATVPSPAPTSVRQETKPASNPQIGGATPAPAPVTPVGDGPVANTSPNTTRGTKPPPSARKDREGAAAREKERKRQATLRALEH